jgi:hypothetical protein
LWGTKWKSVIVLDIKAEKPLFEPAPVTHMHKFSLFSGNAFDTCDGLSIKFLSK